MLVYNVTIKINTEVADNWLHWQINEHIPEVMATGLFDSFKFFRLLDQDETDGLTYIVQYLVSSMENYTRYINEFAPGFRKKITDEWGEHFVAFRSLMELVQ